MADRDSLGRYARLMWLGSHIVMPEWCYRASSLSFLTANGFQISLRDYGMTGFGSSSSGALRFAHRHARMVLSGIQSLLTFALVSTSLFH